MIQTLLQNWKRFEQANPEVQEAIRECYEVGAYDQETQMIMSRQLVNGELKIRVIEDGHTFPAQMPLRSRLTSSSPRRTRTRSVRGGGTRIVASARPAIAEKMAYNATRPQRHGGKVL